MDCRVKPGNDNDSESGDCVAAGREIEAGVAGDGRH
jgi:hypothetical protein